jgi:hypothetical protein
MLILPSLLLALAFAILLLAAARLPGVTSQWIGGYLLVTGQLIATFLVLSTLGQLNSRYLTLAVQAVLTALAAAVWLWRGRPPLPRFLPARSEWAEWRAEWRPFPQVVLLLVFVALAYAFLLVLIRYMAPNTHDSLTIHLDRVGYWLQHGSLLPWQAFDMRPVIYPANASLLLYWTVLFWGDDSLAGLSQWTAGLVLFVCVFGLARLLQASRVQSLFAAGMFACFPLILMQGSSTQIDLVSAALFVPAVYFLLLGMRSGERMPFVFSGLSLGLALGAKQTTLFLLPGLVLFALLQWGYWRSNLSRLWVWVGSAAIFCLAMGTFMYAVNLVYFGTPFGPAEVVARSSSPLTRERVAQNLLYNLPRLAYDAVDFAGLPPPLPRILGQAKAQAASAILGAAGLPLDAPVALAPNHTFVYRTRGSFTEEGAWFGPLSLLALYPIVIYEFVRALRRGDMLRVGLVLMATTSLIMDVLQRPGYDNFQGRYLISAAAVVAPLMGSWVRNRLPNQVYVWILVTLTLLVGLRALLYNPSKPVSTGRLDIFNSSRIEQQALSASNLWPYLQLAHFAIPARATVAFYSPTYIWDYVLFGEAFTRTVIPVVDGQLLSDDGWLREQGVDYVLVNVAAGDAPPVSDRYRAYREVEGEWALYKLKKSPP